MIHKYLDRKEAGSILASTLSEFKNKSDTIVLALPRGGVPVGFEIAATLNVPLDVFIVRKLGVPNHAELAMGAIALGGLTVFNEDVLSSLQIKTDAIQKIIEQEEKEIQRRNDLYRKGKPWPNFKGKTIILVDDGIATGATIRAAIYALKASKPASLIVAVPVADKSICKEIEKIVDTFVCPMQVDNLCAVGLWYQNFEQTEDIEVFRLLNASEHLTI